MTPASDLYSLGVIVYQMLVGSLPFEDTGDVMQLLTRILMEDLPSLEAKRPDLPKSLIEIVDRMCRRKIDSR